MKQVVFGAFAVLAIIFTIFSTAVMSYISLAIPIGPWIEPTLVFVGMIVFRCVALLWRQVRRASEGIILATIAGGIGGIIASACAWSFPTLHFLHPEWFAQWLQQPLLFSAILGGLVFVSGGCGLLIARFFEARFIHDTTLPFPIATMMYRIVDVQHSIHRAYQLIAGALLSCSVGVIQMVMTSLPNYIRVIPSLTLSVWRIPSVTFNLSVIPMLWAIGVITGHVIAIPFAVGVVSKLLFIDPLQLLFFPASKSSNFLLAFCSGMVVQGALMSFIDVPATLMYYVRRFKKNPGQFWSSYVHQLSGSFEWYEVIGVISAIIIFFTAFKFSLLSQAYMLIATCACAYHLMEFMARSGLAPLGRFATFVMVPGLLFFGFNYAQVTLLAAFVEIVGGVAADSISGRKIGNLMNLSSHVVHAFQWIGVAVSSLVIGIIFWSLITHFGLGSPELLAQKAQSRALLVTAYDFDYIVIMIGIIFGFILKHFKISGALVFGSLLMPLDWSLILIISGLSTYIVKDRDAQTPFWSGVFAASSLLMIIRALW